MLKGKSVTAIIMVCIFALFLAGCSAESPQVPADTKKTDDLVIGYLPMFMGNSFQAQGVDAIKEAAARHPEIKEVIVANPELNVETQINQVRNMIDKKVDAIVLMSLSPTALNPVLEEAVDAGIPVVVSDALVTSEKVTSQVGVDEFLWGEKTAQWLADQLDGKGKIIALNGIAGNSSNNDRWNGAKSVLEKYPDIEILAEANCDWDQAKAQTTVANWLAAYPEIDGVWSQGGAMTAGAMIEFEKAKRKIVPMTGEAHNGFLMMWLEKKDKGFGSIAPVLPNYNVQIALEVALKAIKGEQVPKKVLVPLPIVDENNLENYIAKDKPEDYWVINSLPTEELLKIIEASN